MLVVPNRHQSVYTRLWCAYEAYLAQEEGKTILIAHSSHFPKILAALPLMATAIVAGVALGLASFFLRVGGPYGGSILAILLVALSLVLQDENCRRMMHLMGQMLCWVQMIHMNGWIVKSEESVSLEVNYALHVCYWLNISLAFCFMEVDRIQARSTVLEAEELQQGYQGSIEHATCSQETDATSIRREIADQVHCVDHAIHVLLTAGMSTPALRDIARMVRIEHAAFSEITAAVFLLGPVAFAGFAVNLLQGVNAGEPVYRGTLVGVSLLSRLILLLLLCRSHWDEQRYILKIMSKFLAVLFWVYLCTMLLNIFLRQFSVGAAARSWLLIGDICSVPSVFFALLGIPGLANLPCGLTVLQIFFSRGNNVVDALRVCVQREPDAESEHCRTPSASFASQWALPDSNGERQISVCPTIGRHWEVLGFQGGDPRTDLNRSGGVLNVLQMFYFFSHHFDLLKAAYLLAQDVQQNYPLACVSINLTKMVIEALLAGKLSKLCNSGSKGVFAPWLRLDPVPHM
eukprot:s929_g19.t1